MSDKSLHLVFHLDHLEDRVRDGLQAGIPFSLLALFG